jgi:transcriptional regulator with XRE-family HTH domain
MHGIEIQFVGSRIKEIRLSMDSKLTEIASKAGISKGLLSRIENGRTIPSLPVLFSIIQALQESPMTFFEKLRSPLDAPFYFHLKEKEYGAIEKEESVGFHYFNIFTHSLKEVTFNAVHLKLDPGAKRDPVTTDGMEFIYLAEGEIDYLLGNDRITMQQGDSLFFDGRVPHLKINLSDRVARILVIYFLFNN